MFQKIKILIFILSALAITLIYYHTNTLEVTYNRLSFSSGERVIKIAQVSDLHSDSIGKLENHLIDTLDKEKPDIIVITGDIATPGGDIEGYKKLISQFKAPKGVYFIPGNWEYWAPVRTLHNILNDHQIINLSNKIHKIDDDLLLVGFDDTIEGKPDFNLFEKLPNKGTKIALFHSPAFFNSISEKIQLSLAGHSHGGQIRLPFIGEIATPEGTGKYVQGLFKKVLDSKTCNTMKHK